MTTSLLLAGPDAPRGVAWLPNGELAALSRGRMWRFRPGPDAVATITSVPTGRSVTLATAKSADVVALTIEGSVRVIRDGKPGPTFAVDGAYAGVVSDDGGFFASRRRGADRSSSIYDLATGKRVAEVGAIDAAWVGDVGVFWDRGAVTLFTTKDRRVRRVEVACGPRVDGAVDVLGKRALRVCERKLVVVDVVSGALREIALRGKPGLEPPRVRFTREGDEPVVEWTAKSFEVVSRNGGTTKLVATPPTLRGPNGERSFGRDGEGLPSPDGTQLLLLPEFDSAPGIVVIDAVTGRDVMRWGGTAAAPARSDLAAFAHERGLEIARDPGGKGAIEVVRIGPPAERPARIPRLRPEVPPCTQDRDGYRTIQPTEIFYSWAPYRGACVCDAKSCTTPKLPHGVAAREGTRLLVFPDAQGNQIDFKGLAFLDGAAGPKQLPAPGEVYGGTFLDGGKSVAVVARVEAEEYEVREIELASLGVTSARRVPELEPGSLQILGTSQYLVATQSSAQRLRALVLPRSGGDVAVDVLAWQENAIARFPDGRVDLVGREAESALGCVSGDTVRPFAACRAKLLARGSFSLE